MSDGQIHALKYGCMLTLEVCRQSMSLGHAAADSAKYIGERTGSFAGTGKETPGRTCRC